ncbi:MAG: hypothetical protein HY677_00260 [Chloroflexi bacterium]|nr:hypothetical protein [Chloroflexota bacterium]
MMSLSSKIVKRSNLRPKIFMSESQLPKRENATRPWQNGKPTQTLLDIARGDAEGVLSRAADEAEQIKKAAWAEGYREGLATARAATASHLDLLADLAQQARADGDELIKNAEQQVVEIVIDAIRKLISSELATNPEAVVATIREIMEGVAANSVVRILVSHEDYALVLPFWEERSQESPAFRHIELVADEKLSGGSCIIDTRSGLIDARVETKLSEMENAFWGAARGWR